MAADGGDHSHQRGTELERLQKLEKLQAGALDPLIRLMAESLARRGEAAAILIPWMESPEGQRALDGILPRLLEAYGRALARLRSSE